MAHSLLSRGAEHFPYNCKPIYMIVKNNVTVIRYICD